MGRLVVVSNRIAPPDDKKASAGGLAVGVLGAWKPLVGCGLAGAEKSVKKRNRSKK